MLDRKRKIFSLTFKAYYICIFNHLQEDRLKSLLFSLKTHATVHSSLFHVPGRISTSPGKYYSTNTVNMRQNGTVRQINDSLLVKFMWCVQFFFGRCNHVLINFYIWPPILRVKFPIENGTLKTFFLIKNEWDILVFQNEWFVKVIWCTAAETMCVRGGGWFSSLFTLQFFFAHKFFRQTIYAFNFNKSREEFLHTALVNTNLLIINNSIIQPCNRWPIFWNIKQNFLYTLIICKTKNTFFIRDVKGTAHLNFMWPSIDRVVCHVRFSYKASPDQVRIRYPVLIVYFNLCFPCKSD